LNKLSPEQVEEICRLKESGESARALAALFRVDVSTVYNILRRREQPAEDVVRVHSCPDFSPCSSAHGNRRCKLYVERAEAASMVTSGEAEWLND